MLKELNYTKVKEGKKNKEKTLKGWKKEIKKKLNRKLNKDFWGWLKLAEKRNKPNKIVPR